VFVVLNTISYLLIRVYFINIKEYVTRLFSKRYKIENNRFTYNVKKGKL